MLTRDIRAIRLLSAAPGHRRRRASPVARGLAALCFAALLAACATPTPNERLTAAQSAYQEARSNTARAELSSVEMGRARTAVERAERSWRGGADQVEVDHLAFLAQQQVELAVTAGRREETERAIQTSARDRDAIQLQASRRQTDAAQAQATTAQMQTSEAEKQAADARMRADELAKRLNDLQAKKTERGLVVTFSDVLFDTGVAQLRPAATARIDQLAQILREYPERNVLVEGFTDSTGSVETNQRLSERRALSVREALIGEGIDPRRVVVRGHAARYPVADNSTASGRQQNRRVEVVLSDAKGELPTRP